MEIKTQNLQKFVIMEKRKTNKQKKNWSLPKNAPLPSTSAGTLGSPPEGVLDTWLTCSSPPDGTHPSPRGLRVPPVLTDSWTDRQIKQTDRQAWCRDAAGPERAGGARLPSAPRRVHAHRIASLEDVFLTTRESDTFFYKKKKKSCLI